MHDRLAPEQNRNNSTVRKNDQRKGIRPIAIGVEVISDANLEKVSGMPGKTYI